MNATPDLHDVKSLLKAGRAQAVWDVLQNLEPDDVSSADLWYMRSLAAQQLGNISDAQSSIDQALAMHRQQPYFCLQAARIAAARGDHDVAIAHFRSALALQPSLHLALSGLGASFLALGQSDEARQVFHRHIAVAPRSPVVLLELARLEYDAGRLPEALRWAEEASAGPDPIGDAMMLAGNIHALLGNQEEALSAYRAADRARPDRPNGALAAAHLLLARGSDEEAKRLFGACLKKHPNSLRAALGETLSLPHVYGSTARLARCRSEFSTALDRLALVPPDKFRKPVGEFLQDLRWTNFLLAYQGQDDRELQSAFGDVMNAVVQANAPEWLTLPPPPPRAGGRIRVGFASHFFYDCTVGRYFSPWVLGLDRDRYEVFVYYTNARESQNTQQIKEVVAAFRHMPGASVLAVAERVRADALDILVYPEIGMHPDTQALACLRLAPVQCAAWGHPTTTGLPTIDWFLSCGAMEPAAAEQHYRERLALLPGIGTAYARPESPAPASRRDLGLPEDKTLYLIPQSAFKIHPDNDALIAAVLAADPNGIGVLFAADAKPVMDALVQRLKPAFEAHALSIRHHLVFLPAMAHDAYLAVNQHCDVMLDTLHWSGGNTALDALSVGLPIVTLPGALMRGRQTTAMLRLLGLDELIVADQAAYVRIAARLGADVSLRESLRARIDAGLPRLFGDRGAVQALNDLLERLVLSAE